MFIIICFLYMHNLAKNRWEWVAENAIETKPESTGYFIADLACESNRVNQSEGLVFAYFFIPLDKIILSANVRQSKTQSKSTSKIPGGDNWKVLVSLAEKKWLCPNTAIFNRHYQPTDLSNESAA